MQTGDFYSSPSEQGISSSLYIQDSKMPCPNTHPLLNSYPVNLDQEVSFCSWKWTEKKDYEQET